jgi:hypothetical protein
MAKLEKNAEIILIIKDMGLTKVYVANWEKHRGHSEKYSGRRIIISLTKRHD